MADASDATGSIIPSRKAQVNTFGALVLAISGWAHQRIFALEHDVADAKASAAAAAATSAAVHDTIADLKIASAESRAASSQLQVQMARFEAQQDQPPPQRRRR